MRCSTSCTLMRCQRYDLNPFAKDSRFLAGHTTSLCCVLGFRHAEAPPGVGYVFFFRVVPSSCMMFY